MTPRDCTELRPLLSAYLDGELESPHAAEVEQHLASCKTCSAILERERILRDAVRTRAPYHRAPASLLDRITAQTTRSAPAFAPPIAQPAARSVGRRAAWQRWTLPLAASLMLAVLVNNGLQYRYAGDHLAGEIVDAHVRSMMADHLADVPSTDQHTVKPWFADKLDFSPPVRDLAADGFPLSGGRLDYIDHHPVAALIYRHRMHVINVFIWPAGNEPAGTPSKQSREGFNLVHWRAGGMDLWAVSDLNAKELDQFAQLLTRKDT